MTKISVSGWTTFTQSAIKLPLPGFKASDQYSNGQYSNMRTLICTQVLSIPFYYDCNYKSPLSGFKISTAALNHYFNGQCMCNEHITIEFSYNTSTCQVPNCEPAKQNKYACICSRVGT